MCNIPPQLPLRAETTHNFVFLSLCLTNFAVKKKKRVFNKHVIIALAVTAPSVPGVFIWLKTKRKRNETITQTEFVIHAEQKFRGLF